eukprot:5505539-Amphidinium_carterae.1
MLTDDDLFDYLVDDTARAPVSQVRALCVWVRKRFSHACASVLRTLVTIAATTALDPGTLEAPETGDTHSVFQQWMQVEVHAK